MRLYFDRTLMNNTHEKLFKFVSKIGLRFFGEPAKTCLVFTKASFDWSNDLASWVRLPRHIRFD